MKWGLALFVIIVALLHQDIWFWTDKTLVFGLIPIGMVYHIGYGLLASLTMAILVRYAWPHELEKALHVTDEEVMAMKEATP
jgi:hypothetical protein